MIARSLLPMAAKKPKEARPGRRPLPLAKVRKRQLSLKFTDAEHQLISEAAELDKDKPHNWGRRMLLIVAELRLAGIPVPSVGAKK